jgi:hypothetical protein
MKVLFFLNENEKKVNIISGIGVLLSLLVNLSPGILFYEFKTRNRELNEIPELMFFSNLINCCITLSYSILLIDLRMIISNIICTLITIIYTSIYLWYYRNELYKFLCDIFITYNLTFEFIYLTTQIFIDLNIPFNEITNTIGIFQSIIGVINTIVPGYKIMQVFINGYYKVIPIYTTISQFLCSLFWAIYGYYISKINLVFICNFIGVLLTLFQIIVYFYYYKKKKDILFNEDLKKDKNKLIDEGNESIKELDYDQESL